MLKNQWRDALSIPALFIGSPCFGKAEE
jgi:hypothetical protein